jgi:hypothetical protein
MPCLGSILALHWSGLLRVLGPPSADSSQDLLFQLGFDSSIIGRGEALVPLGKAPRPQASICFLGQESLSSGTDLLSSQFRAMNSASPALVSRLQEISGSLTADTSILTVATPGTIMTAVPSSHLQGWLSSGGEEEKRADKACLVIDLSTEESLAALGEYLRESCALFRQHGIVDCAVVCLPVPSPTAEEEERVQVLTAALRAQTLELKMEWLSSPAQLSSLICPPPATESVSRPLPRESGALIALPDRRWMRHLLERLLALARSLWSFRFFR